MSEYNGKNRYNRIYASQGDRPVPQLTGSRPRLLTTKQAAAILNVNQRTIQEWISQERIPYVRLPSSGSRPNYRIPLQALLQSLSGNFDLAGAIRELDERSEAAEALTDEEIAAVFDD